MSLECGGASVSLEAEIQEALASRHDVSAIACVDETAGMVLGLVAKTDVSRDAVELAVLASGQLCSAPSVWDEIDGDDAPCEASLVVSGRWVHAFARVPRRPELVLLGLAQSGANVTLLRSWLREVAERVGRAA